MLKYIAIKLLCFFNLVILFCNVSFSASSLKRLETEYKFSLPNSLKSKEKLLLKRLKEVLNNKVHELEYSKVIKRDYYLDQYFNSFVFEDTYFDTKDYSLLKKGHSLRARYRWTSPWAYDRFQYLNFISSFYPNRLEFQIKTNYKVLNNKISSFESRFDFSGNSYPFNKQPNPTSPPWRKGKFLKLIKEDFIYGAINYPAIELRKILNSKEVDSTVTMKVNRKRLHINIDNLWGGGGNPNQVFVISLDHGTIKKTKNLDRKEFYELEIELERNATARILEFIKTSENRFLKKRAESLIKILKRDHEKISKEVEILLINEFKIEITDAVPKYKRVMEF